MCKTALCLTALFFRRFQKQNMKWFRVSAYHLAVVTDKHKSMQFTKWYTSKWNYLHSILGKCLTFFISEKIKAMVILSVRLSKVTPVRPPGSSSSPSSFNRWLDQLTIHFKLAMRGHCTPERGAENVNIQSLLQDALMLGNSPIKASHSWIYIRHLILQQTQLPTSHLSRQTEKRLSALPPNSAVDLILRSDDHWCCKSLFIWLVIPWKHQHQWDSRYCPHPV